VDVAVSGDPDVDLGRSFMTKVTGCILIATAVALLAILAGAVMGWEAFR
jgi:hypothetical protein